MLHRNPRRNAGSGNLQFLVMVGLFVVACYVGIQMGKPYYAYRSLERTMEQWAKITIFRGGNDHSDLIEKMKWTIDRHKIPLNIEDVEIVYDPEEKMLSVSAEYHVYVEFPGYVHHYFFRPHAEVFASED